MLWILLAMACTDAPGKTRVGPSEGDTGGDMGGDTDEPLTEGCRSTPAAANRDRLVLIAHPYDVSGAQADTWATWQMDEDGELSNLDHPFTLGRAFAGTMRWTPDGQVGVIAHDDGSLGVVLINEGGLPGVVHASLTGDFYAGDVAVDPSGEWLWITDSNTVDNGGGIYRAAIDCTDGTLTDVTPVVSARLPTRLLVSPYHPDHAVLVGTEAGGAADAAAEVHLLNRADTSLSLADSGMAFGDENASFMDAALSRDGTVALVADNSAWSGVDHRVAAVPVDGAVGPAQVSSEIFDPTAFVVAPNDDVVLVLSTYGDGVFILDLTPGSATPMRVRGELPYTGASPELPGGGAVVPRGELAGLAVVSEVSGIRRIWMQGEGTVTDLGRTTTGSGYDSMVGAIGLQP